MGIVKSVSKKNEKKIPLFLTETEKDGKNYCNMQLNWMVFHRIVQKH